MIILIAAAWSGMDFSPGFSEMFVFAFVILTAAATVLRSVVNTQRNKSLKTAAEMIAAVLMCIGCMAVIASGYIYAVGDDLLNLTVRRTLILTGFTVALLLALLLVRSKSQSAATAECIFSLPDVLCILLIVILSSAAGWFLLLCGITSTALIPCGVSMFSLTVSELLRLYGKRLASVCLFIISIFMADVFLLSPMLFHGH
ncbi:MAG: hypothetical protein IJJ25_13430 [Lachnospiraceae bacterium]|nr:hypothetical protein [Lachnospiraceae bacterium]